MMRLPFVCIVSFCLCVQVLSAQPSLRLNEFMASNGGSSFDPDFGQAGDWIEIYNSGIEVLNLTGFYLTNDSTNPTQWPFPVGTQIGPGEYLVIWADEANILLHTNFQLDIEGGQIALFDATGNALDSINYGPQKTDVTFGLLNNTPGVWRYLEIATPRAANDDTGFIGFTEPVAFSIPGGFYSSTQRVALSTAGLGTIHYTTDGSLPTPDSPIYSSPFSVGAPVVLRAAAFQPDFLPSVVITQSYFINQQTQLPVFAISMDPDDLFSDAEGIYVEGTNGEPGNCSETPKNWNRDWEKVANVEFFETDGTSVINQQAGVKISGGCSRNYAQKSLALLARQEYGNDSFDHAIFPQKDVTSYRTLELRNSGQDWFRTMFRDGMVHTLLEGHEGMNVLAYRPVIVYLNGAYWGIHNIRELPDIAYLEQNYGALEGQVDLLEGLASPIEGSADAYNQMLDFIRVVDMSTDQSLASVEALMDVDQYIDYQAAQIYVANADWPSANIKFWRTSVGDNRWRWIMFDTDLGFGGNENGQPSSNTLFQATDPAGPAWPNPPEATELLRRLLENENFEHRFVQRMASHMNITFDSLRVNQVVDSLAAAIAVDVPAHEIRWEESIGFNTPWDLHIGSLRDFSRERPAFMRSFIADQFGYTETASLQVTVNEPGRGTVYISDVEVHGFPFEGTYFSNVPLELKAKAAEGFVFVGWVGNIEAGQDSLSVVLNGSTAVQAVFEEVVDMTSNEDIESPFTFGIGQNYPNPFSTITHIPFELEHPNHVRIRLVDLLGREVLSIREEYMVSGRHMQILDAGSLATGNYIVELQAGDKVVRRSIVIVK